MAKKVDFILSSELTGGADGGVLLGEFNNWNENKGTSLKKQKDGSLKASLTLEPGTYQYRYFLSDGRWVNDQNGSSENGNCIIHISAEEVKPAKAKTTTPKVATKAAVKAEAKPAKAAPAKASAKNKK